MDQQKLTDLLKLMINEADELRDYNRDSAKFRTWEDKVYRRIINIYGKDSREYFGFKGIPFNMMLGQNIWEKANPSVQKRHFNDCLDEAKLFFEGLIEDIQLFPKKSLEESSETQVKKIFISHSSKDKKIVSEIVHLLSLIGVQDSSIFCTSLSGYDIPLGDNWLETLKSEISGEVIVLFVLSENYFQSNVSLCEMGAAWVLSKKHVPILIPPVEFKNIDGVIPLTQGLIIRDKHKWTQLKTQLEILFNLSPKAPQIWETRRDEILERIEYLLIP
ncbi:toll/interleukin-1 receptor domain-containing protein [Algoriphagus formosus]|uniref:Toll/interleukin-1 receptor domain-containing protein n=1 Tax=Algoriphagus formosus TaxID=2007308 RepID=A0A4R5UW34_9BACT|nr:toll/interleukin-1 receptor domain-containing protein [Algoriphagus aquimaris]TDK43480.1 toll/interleukin-1 receptor domain-containing protein [Algoriphagus aquimaris]